MRFQLLATMPANLCAGASVWTTSASLLRWLRVITVAFGIVTLILMADLMIALSWPRDPLSWLFVAAIYVAPTAAVCACHAVVVRRMRRGALQRRRVF
jgi:hypothetical protein